MQVCVCVHSAQIYSAVSRCGILRLIATFVTLHFAYFFSFFAHSLAPSTPPSPRLPLLLRQRMSEAAEIQTALSLSSWINNLSHVGLLPRNFGTFRGLLAVPVTPPLGFPIVFSCLVVKIQCVTTTAPAADR